MDIQENHRITLLNAKCSYVKSLDLITKKMSYGEDISECCARKLFLASQLINRLDCYDFSNKTTTTITSTTFKSTLLNSTATSISGYIFHLYLDGVVIGSYQLPYNQGTQTVLLNLLNASGLSFQYYQGSESGSNIFNPAVIGFWTINTPCTTTTLSISFQTSISDPLTEIFTSSSPTISGVCGTANSVVYNCWKDSDLPKLYEVLDNLLQ